MSDTPWATALEGTTFKVELAADGLALRLSRIDDAALPTALPAVVLQTADLRVVEAERLLALAANQADYVDSDLASTLRAWTP